MFETVRVAKNLCKAVTVNSVIFAPRTETGRADQLDDPDRDLYMRVYRYQAELNGKELMEISEEKLPPAGGPDHDCAKCGLRCGGGRSGYVINWRGEMMPCNRMEVIKSYPLRDGFAKAWTSLNQTAESWPAVPECERCAYRDVCDNCAASILSYGEPGKRPEALCELTRYYVRHGVRQISDCE